MKISPCVWQRLSLSCIQELPERNVPLGWGPGGLFYPLHTASEILTGSGHTQTQTVFPLLLFTENNYFPCNHAKVVDCFLREKVFFSLLPSTTQLMGSILTPSKRMFCHLIIFQFNWKPKTLSPLMCDDRSGTRWLPGGRYMGNYIVQHFEVFEREGAM